MKDGTLLKICSSDNKDAMDSLHGGWVTDLHFSPDNTVLLSTGGYIKVGNTHTERHTHFYRDTHTHKHVKTNRCARTHTNGNRGLKHYRPEPLSPGDYIITAWLKSQSEPGWGWPPGDPSLCKSGGNQRGVTDTHSAIQSSWEEDELWNITHTLTVTIALGVL